MKNQSPVYLFMNEIEKAEYYLTSGYRKVIQVHEPATMERAFADHQLGNLHMVKGHYSLADSLMSQAVFTLQKLEKSMSIKQQIMIKDIEKLRVIRNTDSQYKNISQSDAGEMSQ
jgi:ATP/maltotriose-dependent transcriptional regulator MalT